MTTNSIHINASDLQQGDTVVAAGAYKIVQGVSRHPLADGTHLIRVDYGQGSGAMFKPAELVLIVDAD